MDKFQLSDKNVKEEEILTTLESAYRLNEVIIGATELSIISTTTEGTITSFNSAAERMLGYRAQEVIGKSTPEFFHDEQEVIERANESSKELGMEIKPGFEVLIAKARISKKTDRKEWTYIRKDGTRFPVMLSVTALLDKGGELIGYAGIATDITEQKEADVKIKQSESHLNALVNSLADTVIEVDGNGNLRNLWNYHDDALLFSRETWENKNIIQVLGTELASRYEAIIKRVVETRKPELLEHKSIKTGDSKWSNAKFSFISPDRVLICIQDITWRKKGELRLIKSEEKFRALAENIPGVIYLCNNDATNSMLYLNSKVEELTGYTVDEFISGQINFLQLYHPEDAPGLFEKIEKALTSEKSFHLNYRLATRSGEWRWVEEMGIGVYHDDSLLFIEGFISDVTAQKVAKEQLQKVAEENYRLFNNAINLSVIAGFDGYFKRLNPTWTRLLGWTEVEMISAQFFDFVHPDDMESTKTAIDHISKGKHLLTFENRYRCKDGAYKWLLWSAASDAKRQLIYASAIDITERKKYEEELLISKRDLETASKELRKQNHQLNEFTHIISHNLRSPVGNIQALISLLNEHSSKEEYTAIFEKLGNTTASLKTTLNDLLEILNVKKDATEQSVLGFEEVFAKVRHDLEGEIIKCDAKIDFDFRQCHEIKYPKTYLESIILNLLSNAIKYRSPERQLQVQINTSINDGKKVLRVADNGLGIDLQLYGDKLFGLRKTFHEHTEARGVGLFLTKTQIETLGGTIRAESEVDKGTTFIITF